MVKRVSVIMGIVVLLVTTFAKAQPANLWAEAAQLRQKVSWQAEQMRLAANEIKQLKADKAVLTVQRDQIRGERDQLGGELNRIRQTQLAQNQTNRAVIHQAITDGHLVAGMTPDEVAYVLRDESSIRARQTTSTGSITECVADSSKDYAGRGDPVEPGTYMDRISMLFTNGKLQRVDVKRVPVGSPQ